MSRLQLPTFRIEPLPWRLPFLGDANLLFDGRRTVIFTPVLNWISLINPGDSVELVNPRSLQTVAYTRVCWLIKELLGHVSPNTLKYWRPDIRDTDALLDFLTDYYQDNLSKLSPLVKIGMCLECEEPETFYAMCDNMKW